ncbi:MAG: 1-acyl-sn-glycerol-3-phosphate acyltransferase [Bacteroidales bacterium]
MEINIKKVIESKSSKLAKYTPNFIIHAIRKIIHEDEINFILKTHGHKTGVEFAAGCLDTLHVSCNVTYTNPESLQKQQRYIFVSNHPLGGLDGLVIINELGKKFGDIKFVVNDLLMNIKPLKPIFVPVNKVGKMSKQHAELIESAYAGSGQILYFPAGLCSRLTHKQITDPPWSRNFLKQALRYNRPIVPMFFSGRNSGFFYKLAQLRKFLKLSFNLEMMFLPDEMFKQKNSIFDVVIGAAIPIESIRSRIEQGTSLQQICEEIRKQTYDLKNVISKKKE